MLSGTLGFENKGLDVAHFSCWLEELKASQGFMHVMELGGIRGYNADKHPPRAVLVLNGLRCECFPRATVL